ncbi:serine protease [Nonomuraea sp. NPDC059194]|uniref:S1 family peptidase n=1 Tax=Nonomuraea sp. NPDC059194 TaxID=3346764 RepID=UPI0036BD168E
MRKSAAAAAGIAALAALTAVQGVALAEPRPKDVAVGTRLAAKTNPAVQLIDQSYTATVVIREPVPTKAFRALFAKAERLAKAGRIPADHQSRADWVLRTAAKNVKKYLAPGKAVRKVATVAGGNCTGWWVTSDGYMVTASHCVGAANAELRQLFVSQALSTTVKNDVRDFTRFASRFAQPDEEMAGLAEKLFVAHHLRVMRLIDLKKPLSVVLHDGQGTITLGSLELVAKGSNFPGEDFALLKMAGARGLPTVSLGRDDDVRVGDSLYISGFPGITVANPNLDARSKLFPSVTEGAYNVKRRTVEGVPYLQAQAPAYHGSSGGPVFGSDGRVIGMLIAGNVKFDGGFTENASFVLPVGIIKRRLAVASVKPVTSATSRIYGSGLEDYFARRYGAALKKFRLVRELYPAHPYVGGFIEDTKKALR